MPIEIIPKKPIKIALWLNILFGFSIFLLLMVGSSYFELKHLQENASTTIQALEAEIKEVKTIIKTPEGKTLEELEKELEAEKEKIDDFSAVLTAHQLNSKFFPLLERATHPKVFFSSLNLNSKELNLALAGETESFQTLGQQIYIFQRIEGIQSVGLSGVSIGKEGRVNFTLSLSLAPTIFK